MTFTRSWRKWRNSSWCGNSIPSPCPCGGWNVWSGGRTRTRPRRRAARPSIHPFLAQRKFPFNLHKTPRGILATDSLTKGSCSISERVRGDNLFKLIQFSIFFLNNPIIQKCHLSEKVVVDVQSASSSFLGKVIRRADEVKVADDFTDPLLIDVSVVDVIPIGVLKKKV